MGEVLIMWRCQQGTCGYLYNPERGDKKGKISPGVPFEELPEDWRCPVCRASKKMFQPVEE